MGQLADLQVYDHIATEQPVVENEIDKKVFFIEGEPFLPGFKEKTLSQFKQEVFKLVNDGGLQIGFGILRLFVQAEKFEHVGIFDHILWFDDDLSFLRKLSDSLFVAAQGKSLIEAQIELASEFRQGPVVLCRLNLIEGTCTVFCYAYEEDILRLA